MESLEVVNLFKPKLSTLINELHDNSFEKFNILDVAGLASQEIKHSNILGRLLDNKDYEFGYQILFSFLGKIKDNFKLTQYLNVIQKNHLDIDVYRHSVGDIDILIIDKTNKKVFVIENKVWAAMSLKL